MRLKQHVLAITSLCIYGSNGYALAANTTDLPKQILRTGVDLTRSDVSPNSRQLAEHLKLTELLKREAELRSKINPLDFEPTLANIATSQQLTATTAEALQIIQEANLSVDFVLAEIQAEQNIYNEILTTYANDRDKKTLKTNAISFILNGVLWTVCEGLDIPTYRAARLSIPSGVTGILAGIVPSIASMYALKQLSGKKNISEADPNMLAKIFNYPVSAEIDYPKAVWDFLNSNAEGEPETRKALLISRWIEDKNIPGFTDTSNRAVLDEITASTPHKNALTISLLNTRLSMLQQLGAEILKMKRMLLELSMVVRGEKQI